MPIHFYLHGLALCSAMLLVSCSGLKEASRSYHVNEDYNEYDEEKMIEQRYNVNRSLGFTASGLNIRKIEGKSNEYYLITYRNSSDPSSLTSDPLKVKADGKEMKFQFVDSHTEVIASSNIQVRGYYSADLEDIERISKSDEVISKISTMDGTYTVTYDQRVMERMSDFLKSN